MSLVSVLSDLLKFIEKVMKNISQLDTILTFEAEAEGLLEYIKKDAFKRFANDTGKEETPVYYYTFTGDDYEKRLIRLVVTDSTRNILFVTIPKEPEEEAQKAWNYLMKLNSHLKFSNEFTLGCHADDFVSNRVSAKVGFHVIC